MSTEEQTKARPSGGLTVSWLLASPARSFTSKQTDTVKTVVELRDPRRLSNALVVFPRREEGPLAAVEPGSVVTLHVDEVRGGRNRGELVATVSRETVEAAFAASRR